MTAEHFKNLKDTEDLFCGGDDFQYNWEALGDCHFLETIEKNGQDITITCGS